MKIKLILSTLFLLGISKLGFSQWVNHTLVEARSEMTTAVVGDKILFAGGNTPSNQVDIYDALTGVWTSHTMSTRKKYPISKVIGDKVYIISDNYGLTDSCLVIDIYDNASLSWTTDTLHPIFDGANFGAQVHNQSIVFNVDNSSLPHGIIVEYNTTLSTWSLDTIADSLRSNKITIHQDEVLWYTNPWTLNQGYLVHYDLITHQLSFDTIPSSAYAEIYTAGDRTFIVGGYYPFSSNTLNYYLVYNHQADTFHLDNYIAGTVKGIQYGSKMYIVGGTSYAGMLSPSMNGHIIIHDLHTDQIQFSYMSEDRAGFALTAACGHVYIAGGYDLNPFVEYSYLDILDTATLNVSTIHLPIARFNVTANAAKDVVVFAGGQLSGSYNFIDQAHVIGCTYTGIEDELANSISIYPNPAASYVQINGNGLNEKMRVQLINSMGQVALPLQYLSNTSQINVSSMVNGLYILQIFSSSGELLYNHSLMINR